ncbi:MAG: TrmH family RNA methyltransferase [Bacteroidales bacterium]
MSNTLSKNLAKLIKSLDTKKGRTKNGLFLAEGLKLVSDMLKSDFELFKLVTTEELADKFNVSGDKLAIDSAENIKKASLQKTPQNTLALFRLPEQPSNLNLNLNLNTLLICLDGLQDPGNLGTIVRTCSWYGINNIICSKDTADIYNPKAMQASMGGLRNVKVHYCDLTTFLTRCKASGVSIIATHTEGKSLDDTILSASSILILGNEGKGVSEEIMALADTKVGLPSFHGGCGAESLNVSIANAIFCHEYRRNNKTTMQ